MPNVKKTIVCPTCGKKDTWQADNTYRPFCSERCKLIDLGAWADESYRVPSPPSQANETTHHSNDEDE